MYIVIIGLGEVGRHLLRVLEPEGHDIVAVDQMPDAVRHVEEHFDVATLLGYGASEEVLERAGVARADLLVAVSDHDEVNLIAALAAKQLGAKRTIARTQGTEWARLGEGVRYGLLGIDVVINPRVLVALEIAKIARSHGAIEVVDLAQDRIELVQVKVAKDSGAIDRPISDLSLPKNVLIAAIVREGQLFVPGGADVLNPQDCLYLVGRPEDIPDAEDLFTSKREARRVWIAGGGVTGEIVARALARDGAEVLVVESSRARAEELGAALPGVSVFHGDATDTRLMTEEEASTYDLFVAVTDDDELNLMASLLSKRLDGPRSAALVHRPDYMSIYRQLGIDIVVSPRSVASDHIVRFCRAAEVHSLTALQGGQAEVIEIRARPGARVLGAPLRQVAVPRGAIIAGIVHNDDVIIPGGDDVIRENDAVIVLVTTAARPAVERLFRPGLL